MTVPNLLRKCQSPRVFLGVLLALVVPYTLFLYMELDSRFSVLSQLDRGASGSPADDSAVSSLPTGSDDSRQVTDFSVFTSPQGIPIHPSYNNYGIKDQFSHLDLEEDDAVRRRLHFSNYLYRGYDRFVNSLGLENDAKKATLTQKCDAFFDELSTNNPYWEVREAKSFNTAADDKGTIVKDIRTSLNEEWKDKYETFADTDEGKYYIEKKYEDIVRDSYREAQEFSDSTTIMRVFGKCFFNDDADRNMETYRNYSSKVYSYLEEALPRFCHSSSMTCMEGAIPVYDDENNYTGEGAMYNPENDNFLEFMRTKINGKGIVISATSSYESMLIGLLRTLRANDNKLPIQIMHRGDLSHETQRRLHLVATQSVEDMFDRDYTDEETLILPHIDLLAKVREENIAFPPQDVWFVDISPCIREKYQNHFTGFGNKILAYFLNSFEEIILMDADAVPLVPTLDFFQTPEYLETGTHLFKDRALVEITRYMQVNTVARLLPINDRSIDTIFEIPLVTNKTMSNSYMGGWSHLCEAGLLAVDRKRHFLAMLMLLQLGFSADFAAGLLYGDKELFWMSFAMAGGEDYSFNRYGAGAVGKSYLHTEFPYNAESGSRTIVSSHPGHTGHDGRLLWINSGFEYCKKDGYEENTEKDFYDKYSKEQLQELFRNPVRLEAIIVPPEIPGYYKPRFPWTLADLISAEKYRDYMMYERNKDALLKSGEELRGSHLTWSRLGGCFNYDHVAYEKVVSYKEDKIYDYGNYFEFDEKVVAHHDFLAKLWLNLGTPKERQEAE